MADQVYTVEKYYDGPVSGTADFSGRPHIYRRLFDDAEDEYGSEFDLTPIDQSLLFLILECWAIWRHWQNRFILLEVSVDSHPGHGGRDADYDQLQSLIKARMDEITDKPVRGIGAFRSPVSAQSPIGARILEVKWREAVA